LDTYYDNECKAVIYSETGAIFATHSTFYKSTSITFRHCQTTAGLQFLDFRQAIYRHLVLQSRPRRSRFDCLHLSWKHQLGPTHQVIISKCIPAIPTIDNRDINEIGLPKLQDTLETSTSSEAHWSLLQPSKLTTSVKQILSQFISLTVF